LACLYSFGLLLLLVARSWSTLRRHRYRRSFPTRRSSDLPPTEPCFYAFSYTVPCDADENTFVVAGSSEVPEGKGNYKDHLVRYQDRKSTRLNSSHVKISYAVFCLKNKNLQRQHRHTLVPG